jgi:cytidylate kinase
LADKLELPLRSCGEAVRAAAINLKANLADLPDEVHRRVDEETVSWALEHKSCIIEGRFLDGVFAECRATVMLIEVTAREHLRMERARIRNNIATFSAEDIQRLDTDDNVFRARMFCGRRSVPWQILDTSGQTVEESVEILNELIAGALSRSLD